MTGETGRSKSCPWISGFCSAGLVIVPAAPTIYRLIQLGTAGALALFCAIQTYRGWATYRVLAGLFCLASIWMTLCGPATESYTYVLLAAPTILALVQSFDTLISRRGSVLGFRPPLLCSYWL